MNSKNNFPRSKKKRCLSTNLLAINFLELVAKICEKKFNEAHRSIVKFFHKLSSIEIATQHFEITANSHPIASPLTTAPLICKHNERRKISPAKRRASNALQMKRYVIENASHQKLVSIKFNSKSAGMHNLVFSLLHFLRSLFMN